MTSMKQQVESFCAFALERIAGGDAQWTIDELYAEWRFANPTDEERRQDLLAINAAIRDMEAGDTGQDFREFMAEFRAKRNIADV